MSAFDALTKDQVVVTRTGQPPRGPFNATVSASRITIFDENADVVEGDLVSRTLPSGRTESYTVLEATFQQGLAGAIPPLYDLKVRKASLPEPRPRAQQSITIHSAHGVQIGDANTQVIVGTLQAIAQAIDASSASDAEKREAKGKLAAFLEHPLVVSLLGAAAGGLLSGLRRTQLRADAHSPSSFSSASASASVAISTSPSAHWNGVVSWHRSSRRSDAQPLLDPRLAWPAVRWLPEDARVLRVSTGEGCRGSRRPCPCT